MDSTTGKDLWGAMPADLKAKLQLLAEAKGCSVEVVITELMTAFMEVVEKPGKPLPAYAAEFRELLAKNQGR